MYLSLNKARFQRLFLASVLCMAVFSPPGHFSSGVSAAEHNISRKEGTLSAYLDNKSATVGSIVTLILKYHLPAGAHLQKNINIQGLGNVTVVDQRMEPDLIRIRILVDRLGKLKTGVLGLTYIDRDNNKHVIRADPVSLTVISNLGKSPEKAHLRPIQGIIPSEPLWLKYLLWSGAAILVLVLVFCLVWWHRKVKERSVSRTSQEPPHIRAIKEINRLVEQKLFEKGHVKAFYFYLSEILRRYLESLRGFPAAEFTTEEIARAISNEKDRELLPLLKQADLVKFSDAVPTPARVDKDIKASLAYINDTAPGDEALS